MSSTFTDDAAIGLLNVKATFCPERTLSAPPVTIGGVVFGGAVRFTVFAPPSSSVRRRVIGKPAGLNPT
jgi:hypothetical protein